MRHLRNGQTREPRMQAHSFEHATLLIESTHDPHSSRPPRRRASTVFRHRGKRRSVLHLTVVARLKGRARRELQRLSRSGPQKTSKFDWERGLGSERLRSGASML